MRKPGLIIFLCVSSILELNAQTSSTKIFDAVKNNDLKEVKTLLENGADPNSVDEDGDLLLMYATLYSSVDCMALLIEKGSKVGRTRSCKNEIADTTWGRCKCKSKVW